MTGERKATFGILIVLSLVFALFPLIESVKAEPNTIVVPDDYATIQEAINHANEGDTITVKSGTYYETVEVNKMLTLKGIDYPLINARRKSSAITILAANCVVDGFKVTQSEKSYSEAGIKVQYYTGGGNVIKNNIAYDNTFGIYLQKTSNNSVINNTCYNNERGIECWVENDDYIANNTFHSNEDIGLLICIAGGMTVEQNIIYAHPEHSAIMLDGCSNSIVKNNHIFNNRWGITIDFGGSGNVITQNQIIANEIGVRWYSALGNNQFFHNNFINKIQQAGWYDIPTGSPATSTWNADYPLGGNFWSDYTGVDTFSGIYQNETGSDGIGDIPYIINEGNQDNYPLMNPWNGSSCVETDGNMSTYEFDFSYGYGTYVVVVLTNSTFEDLSLDQNQISFLVTGPTGTTGVAKIIIPEDLTGSNFPVYLNDSMLLENFDYTKTYNGTHTVIDIKYRHSTHIITITGTNVVPEYSSWLIPTMLMAATMCIVIYKKRLSN